METFYPPPILLNCRYKINQTSHTLKEIGTRLLAWDPKTIQSNLQRRDAHSLQDVDHTLLTVTPPHSQAVFQQLTLPMIATSSRQAPFQFPRVRGTVGSAAPPASHRGSGSPVVQGARSSRRPRRQLGRGL